ncbi:hypothetical protein BU25DRAFT_408879 [Macroventuria anomochaeta]|uniref:Uncharacterized protein n=1 Tax=Macroventuria anomochaeta TaxID=301207 RepID=A0ACB6S5S3_9PLEO|nr:uncharacterized protein BU25DRAFT_408879 [Macroventuria anomochaeta]KAF2629615.1 hypothetical protein BU25DRAFT_408879 [Macroventuria anomochaeta]
MFRARHFLHRTPFNVTTRSCRHTRAPLAPLELPLQSKFRWSYLWYGTILALGISTGLGARHFAAPLGLPEPGSRDDALIIESLNADIDKLDIVRELRKQSYSVHSDVPLSGAADVEAPKAWLEIDLGKSEVEKGGLLGTMSGTRGLGVQRAFWNAETREMVAVVWIGGGLSGWPGVAHGGAIATVFEEAMARMVRGPNGNIGRWSGCRYLLCAVLIRMTEQVHRPTSLKVTYAKPTYSLDFYILRASFAKPNLPQTEPVPEPETEPTKSWLSWLSPQKDMTKKSEPGQLIEIIGTLESVKGDLCVRAKGTFAAPALVG